MRVCGLISLGGASEASDRPLAIPSCFPSINHLAQDWNSIFHLHLFGWTNEGGVFVRAVSQLSHVVSNAKSLKEGELQRTYGHGLRQSRRHVRITPAGAGTAQRWRFKKAGNPPVFFWGRVLWQVLWQNQLCTRLASRGRCPCVLV